MMSLYQKMQKRSKLISVIQKKKLKKHMNRQFKEAIGYYEEYIAKYDETYIEEIYYKLALAYEDTDLNKSKEYAEHIKKEFSNSIYNNSKISQIISK